MRQHIGIGILNWKLMILHENISNDSFLNTCGSMNILTWKLMIFWKKYLNVSFLNSCIGMEILTWKQLILQNNSVIAGFWNSHGGMDTDLDTYDFIKQFSEWLGNLRFEKKNFYYSFQTPVMVWTLAWKLMFLQNNSLNDSFSYSWAGINILI